MPKKVSENYEVVGAEPKKVKAVPAPSHPPGFIYHPTIIYPAAPQIVRRQLERTQSPSCVYSKSFRGTLTSAASAVIKPVADPIDSKPQTDKKVGYLQLFVVIAVVVSFLLIASLSILLYFALSSHTGNKVWVGTAHELCQAKYGKCSIFVGAKGQEYPPNCTLIPCRTRCFYPTIDLNGIDPIYKMEESDRFVSGKDGLICNTHSLCKGKTCVQTSTSTYDHKVDPKSTVDCIKNMYGGTNESLSGCIDKDKCHKGNLCTDKHQIQIGFNISCSGATLNTCTNINGLSCGTRCGYVDNITTEMLKKELEMRNCATDRGGKCFHTCKYKEGSTINAGDGVPCNRGGRSGYCWRGRCFEQERFVHTEDNPGLIDESCYKKSGTCYYDTLDCCAKKHLLDRNFKPITRYGSNCRSWDQKSKIPKQYHKLGSYGCILHDEKMPWCYSTNPNVEWNYCYTSCRDSGIKAKDSGSIRVATYSFPMRYYSFISTANRLAIHLSQVSPDIILMGSWPSAHSYEWKFNFEEATKKEWKQCGDPSSSNPYSIYIRKSNGTTITLKDTSQSAGCMVTKAINNKTQNFAVIITHLNDAHRSPGKFCKGFSSGDHGCKGSVPECEAPRIDDAKRLLAAVQRQLSDFGKTNIILGGSFNQPSHLDWTPEAAHLHCNATHSWTISNLMQQAGYVDSYRQIWKDPSIFPGITFSPLKAYNDYPQDRLDFIYFRGPSIKATKAHTYPAAKPGIPYRKDWPSDRYAVVVDYQFK